MSRKRLGDLLREEVGKTLLTEAPQTPASPIDSPVSEPGSAKIENGHVTNGKAETSKAQVSKRSPGRTPKPDSKAKSTPPEPITPGPDTATLSQLSQLQTDLAQAQQQSTRLAQELETVRQGEVVLKQELSATRASEQALKGELAELQAQFKEQQTKIQKLQKQQEQTQSLKDELAAAKKMILQLSTHNSGQNSGATQLQLSPTPAQTAKPVSEPTAKPAQPEPEPTAQPYRFERIGWKPLANHLIQPEAHSTKLTDSDIGWVD